MVFYDNLENSNERDLKNEREQIKHTLAKTLVMQGFSDNEVNEVIKIIEEAEIKIQEIKDSLIGTNLNEKIDMQDPMRPINEAREKIREIEFKMAQDIKSKVNEIKARH